MKRYKIQTLFTFLFCIAIVAVNAQKVKLQEGTSLRLAIRQELSSKTAQAGDIVELEVIDDI